MAANLKNIDIYNIEWNTAFNIYNVLLVYYDCKSILADWLGPTNSQNKPPYASVPLYQASGYS